MSTDLLKHLSEKIQDEIKEQSDVLASGAARDYAEYKATCGMIRGLMFANGILVEVAEHMEKSDD